MDWGKKMRDHRDLLGCVLAAGDELDSMQPGWLEMQAGYELLSTWLDTLAPAARRTSGGPP